MNILILSDIHGNCTALEAVNNEFAVLPSVDACILLGDLVDYGPRSNEVIEMIKLLSFPIVCNLRGNHEDAFARNI